MALLVITSSPTEQTGKQFELTKRTLAGGRDPAREIQIIDPEVSRKHFLIQYRNDSYVISETKTLNGVVVNGVKITEKILEHGDEIRVGQTVLRYIGTGRQADVDALQEPRRADRHLREMPTILPGQPKPPDMR